MTEILHFLDMTHEGTGMHGACGMPSIYNSARGDAAAALEAALAADKSLYNRVCNSSARAAKYLVKSQNLFACAPSPASLHRCTMLVYTYTPSGGLLTPGPKR